MNNTDIPGFQSEPGRRYVYIQSPNGRGGSDIQDDLSPILKKLYEQGRGPIEGGLMFDECRITCPDHRQFYAFTFRGDLDGWQKVIDDYASSKSLITGVIRGDAFKINDGCTFALSECTVTVS